MSTNYYLQCRRCDEPMNHSGASGETCARGLYALRPHAAELARTCDLFGELEIDGDLRGLGFWLRLDWFASHRDHDLYVVDEYGKEWKPDGP